MFVHSSPAGSGVNPGSRPTDLKVELQPHIYHHKGPSGKKIHTETHLMSGEHASLPTLIATHDEKCDPGQHKGDDEGHEEPGHMEAVVRQNLRDKRGRIHLWSHFTSFKLSYDELTAKQGQGQRDAPRFAPSSATY